MKKLFLLILFIGALACSRPQSDGIIRSFPLDDLTGVIASTNVTIDKEMSSDGGGSLRIDAPAEITVPLFEISDIDIDNARIFYRAKVKTENVFGQVYLEMLCHFPEKGEFFSRGQGTLMSGSTDWTSQETPFILQKGEKPDLIKLNLVINGSGTVWIDDIKLARGPLR
jgi:hypothetical protein